MSQDTTAPAVSPTPPTREPATAPLEVQPTRNPARTATWPERVRASLTEMATADPRTLGLFRICFGTYLLVDLYRRLPDYVLFYTNDGMLPAHASIARPMSPFLFSVFHAAHTPNEVLAFFALTACVYTAFLVGYRT